MTIKLFGIKAIDIADYVCSNYLIAVLSDPSKRPWQTDKKLVDKTLISIFRKIWRERAEVRRSAQDSWGEW